MIKCDNAHCERESVIAETYYLKLFLAIDNMEIDYAQERIDLCDYCKDRLITRTRKLFNDLRNKEEVI